MTNANVTRLYKAAKNQAIDSLGGGRAYWIAGPTIRRHAMANAILSSLTAQDESISAETVRDVMNGLYDTLVNDRDFGY